MRWQLALRRPGSSVNPVPLVTLFRFTKIWEEFIVRIWEKWIECILISKERLEPRFA
jgi:hypothetical protein